MKLTRAQLPNHINVFIENKEYELDRKCRSMWTYTNPHGNQFIFGSFCRDYNRLIVTIAHWCDRSGWIPQRPLHTQTWAQAHEDGTL